MESGCYLRYRLRVHFNLFVIALRSLSLETIPSPKNRHRERIVGWVGKYSILSIQFSRKMTRLPFLEGPRRSFSQILSLKLECATKGEGERVIRRKRISSISQRVAVTVSVMAFGSVVESYSCANPIRALLRVYFRTRVACTSSRCILYIYAL